MPNLPTFDPQERELQLLRQALNLITQAAHDTKRITRSDLRTLIAVTTSLLEPEKLASWQIMTLRSGLSEHHALASFRKLRRQGYLTPDPDDDFELTPSDPGDKPLRVSTLKRLALRGALRMRAFGEEHAFAIGVPHFGGLHEAVQMLPRLLLNGFLAVYRDEKGLFVGPTNPRLIDEDPLSAIEQEVVDA